MQDKILVVHGPNLNLLGKREPEIYGTVSLEDINNRLIKIANQHNYLIAPFFSNSEGSIVSFIQEEGIEGKGLVINPAAYTHTSVAIRDAVLARKLPMVEVHLSNIYKREAFRRNSYFHDIAIGCIFGFGHKGYEYALMAIIDHLAGKKE